MIKILLDIENVNYKEANKAIDSNKLLKGLFYEGVEILEIENRFFMDTWLYTYNVSYQDRIYQIQEIMYAQRPKQDIYKRILILDITEEVWKFLLWWMNIKEFDYYVIIRLFIPNPRRFDFRKL